MPCISAARQQSQALKHWGSLRPATLAPANCWGLKRSLSWFHQHPGPLKRSHSCSLLPLSHTDCTFCHRAQLWMSKCPPSFCLDDRPITPTPFPRDLIGMESSCLTPELGVQQHWAQATLPGSEVHYVCLGLLWLDSLSRHPALQQQGSLLHPHSQSCSLPLTAQEMSSIICSSVA